MIGPKDDILRKANLHLPQVHGQAIVRLLVPLAHEERLPRPEQDVVLVLVVGEVGDVSTVYGVDFELDNVTFVIVPFL